MILDKTQLLIKNKTKTIINFEASGNGNGVFPFWERYLTVDGNKVFRIGNACSTCSVFFEKLKDLDTVTYQKISNLHHDGIKKLNHGITVIDQLLVDTLQLIMPNGEYYIVLSKVFPKLTHPGKTGDYFVEERAELLGRAFNSYGGALYPKTEYYRTHTFTMEGYSCGFFEFLIPLFSSEYLHKERVNFYEKQFMNNFCPTVVTLSVLDIFEPERGIDDAYFYSRKLSSHACLTHYLIDGHHKTYVAAMLGKPLTMLSFLAIEKGLSSIEVIEESLEALKNYIQKKEC